LTHCSAQGASPGLSSILYLLLDPIPIFMRLPLRFLLALEHTKHS
jgi:hypothetical protein